MDSLPFFLDEQTIVIFYSVIISAKILFSDLILPIHQTILATSLTSLIILSSLADQVTLQYR